MSLSTRFSPLSPSSMALSLLLFSATGSQAVAQVFAETTGPSMAAEFGAAFAASEAEYETDGTDPDIERKWLGVTLNYGIGSTTSIIGQGAFLFDSEWDVGGDLEDGTGYMAGLGLLSEIHAEGSMRFHGYGLVNYTSESWDDEIGDVDFEIEMDILDIHLGSTVLFALGSRIEPFVGLDLALFSDGEVEAKAGSSKSDEDIERDDLLTMHVGAQVSFDSFVLRPEVILLGEQTLLLHVGFR